MEESHVKCQKLGAEKGLSPCAGRAVLRVTVVPASSYMESCIFEKCRADLQAVGICQGVCLDFLPPLGAAVPVNWVVWLAALGAGLRQCCSELPFLRCWEDEAQVSCQA